MHLDLLIDQANPSGKGLLKSKFGYVYAVSFRGLLKVGYSANNPIGRVKAHEKYVLKLLKQPKLDFFISQNHYNASQTEKNLILLCKATYGASDIGHEWFFAEDNGSAIIDCLRLGRFKLSEPTTTDRVEDIASAKKSEAFLRFLGMPDRSYAGNSQNSCKTTSEILQEFTSWVIAYLSLEGTEKHAVVRRAIELMAPELLPMVDEISHRLETGTDEKLL